MNVSIYGTKEEEEPEITLNSKYISTIPFTTKYIYDENLNDGEQIIDIQGIDGYVSEGYIVKKINGTTESNVMLSRNTYNPRQQVVRIGTKKEENVNNIEENEDEENIENVE